MYIRGRGKAAKRRKSPDGTRQKGKRARGGACSKGYCFGSGYPLLLFGFYFCFNVLQPCLVIGGLFLYSK